MTRKATAVDNWVMLQQIIVSMWQPITKAIIILWFGSASHFRHLPLRSTGVLYESATATIVRGHGVLFSTKLLICALSRTIASHLIWPWAHSTIIRSSARGTEKQRFSYAFRLMTIQSHLRSSKLMSELVKAIIILGFSWRFRRYSDRMHQSRFFNRPQCRLTSLISQDPLQYERNNTVADNAGLSSFV